MSKFLEILVSSMLRVLASLPLGFHYACAGCIAWIMKDVIHYRRNEVMINLARSFPDKKYKELSSIADKFYRHFADIIVEMVWFGGCVNPQRLLKQGIVTMPNPEELDKAFENPHGTLILTSHCGNWELLGGMYDYDASPQKRFDINDFAVVYKPLKSKVWNDVMLKNRCAPVIRRGFNGYLGSGEVMRYVIQHKNEQKIYVFLNDQYPYKIAKDRDRITFMHQETNAMEAAASMAHKFGMSVLYMNIKPVSRGHYEMWLAPICSDGTTMTPQQINEQFFLLLERDLNEVPWNYLWSHKRWK